MRSSEDGAPRRVYELKTKAHGDPVTFAATSRQTAIFRMFQTSIEAHSTNHGIDVMNFSSAAA